MRAESDERLTSMVGQLALDSRNLVIDEVRLAQLELHQGARAAARGVAGVAAAFGIAVIAATATTALFAMLLGDALGELWLGCVVIGAAEILVGTILVSRGRRRLATPAELGR